MKDREPPLRPIRTWEKEASGCYNILDDLRSHALSTGGNRS